MPITKSVENVSVSNESIEKNEGTKKELLTLKKSIWLRFYKEGYTFASKTLDEWRDRNEKIKNQTVFCDIKWEGTRAGLDHVYGDENIINRCENVVTILPYSYLLNENASNTNKLLSKWITVNNLEVQNKIQYLNETHFDAPGLWDDIQWIWLRTLLNHMAKKTRLGINREDLSLFNRLYEANPDNVKIDSKEYYDGNGYSEDIPWEYIYELWRFMVIAEKLNKI